MKKMIQKGWHGTLFSVMVAVVILLFLFAVNNLKTGKNEEGVKQLKQALQHCAVACYATEGIYPPDVEYMKEHYGIRYDEEHYIVKYEMFALNLMPDITVLEKAHEK